MNTRFMACGLVIMLSHTLTGCGGAEHWPNPLTPSVPTPQPPQRPLVDLTGHYVLTFEAGTSCEHLPQEFRTRTYNASIGYAGPAQSGGVFFYAELSGAHFHGELSRLVLNVTGNYVRFDLSDNIVAEKPAPDTYLMIAGSGGAAAVDPSDLSTISTSFDGFFEYCVTTSSFKPGSHCPVDVIARAACTSKDSRWTLTRVRRSTPGDGERAAKPEYCGAVPEPRRRARHTPLSCATLLRLIALSGE
jgi:hypothetical protein